MFTKSIPSLKRISYNIEYSMSKGRRKFLLLTGIFFVSILILFVTTSWVSISTTRSEFGHHPVGDYPNYFDFTPENVINAVLYWQSPEYGIIEKIEFVLTTPILIYGSFDPEFSVVSGAFQITLGPLVGIISMAILLGVYTNLWLLARKSGCKIGTVTKVTGAVAGGGSVASGIFSMLLIGGSDGGTGIIFLLFSLPVIGPVFSGFYAEFDTGSVLLITIPANLLLIGLIFFIASKQVGLPTEEDETTKGINGWLKVAAYLIVPAIFLTTFALALYWWNFQSIAVIESGITGGVQNTTVAIYTTLPLSASLFLMSAFTQLRRIFLQPKPIKI